MLKCEGFASMQQWPAYDESKVDKKAEASAMLVDNTRKDIIEILRLTKIEAPKKITLFVAEKWKYEFMEKLKGAMKKTRDVGEIMKSLMGTGLKAHGKEISRLVPKLAGDESKVPQFVLSQDEEFHALKDSSEHYAKEFNCKVEVLIAEDAKEGKAKQAMPSKSAILVE